MIFHVENPRFTLEISLLTTCFPLARSLVFSFMYDLFNLHCKISGSVFCQMRPYFYTCNSFYYNFNTRTRSNDDWRLHKMSPYRNIDSNLYTLFINVKTRFLWHRYNPKKLLFNGLNTSLINFVCDLISTPWGSYFVKYVQ